MSSRAVRKELKRLEAQKELERRVPKEDEQPEDENEDEEAEDVTPAPVNPFAMVRHLKTQALIVS